MQTSLCPFCLKTVQSSLCPYCGKDVDYPGYPNHLPVGFTLHSRSTYILGAAKGQGGFGITYIALDPDSGRRFAIKEYYPNHCCGRNNSTYVYPSFGQEETFNKGKDHFLKEAQMLQSLSDIDHVVNVYDFFEANNSAYLVMEYLEGCSLKDYVEQQGKFPAQQFLQQIKPMMADIARMHSRGVIHRDIAPDNIILLQDGRMKLIDFGAARSYVGDKSMTVVVKKGFAPVEQYMRKGSGACTDVYALAATIYYCITGIVPPDSAERQYGEERMTAPSALGADLTPIQEFALEKALELQPKDRIQTISDLAERLFSSESRLHGQQLLSEETYQTLQENCPIAVESLKLVYDHDRNITIATPTFKNLTSDKLRHITVQLHYKTADNSSLLLAQADIPCKNTKRNERITSDLVIALPQEEIRDLRLSITGVTYENGTVVSCGSHFEKIEEPDILASHFAGNDELLSQYKTETTPRAVYAPVSGQYFWRCTCGCTNLSHEAVCHDCETDRSIQFEMLNLQNLSAATARRREAAEKAAAEEAKRLAEEARIRREKIKQTLLKTAKITAVTAASVALLWAGIWSVKFLKYNSAGRAMAEGNYEAAWVSYTALNDFRDSQQQARVARYAHGDALQQDALYLDAAQAFEETSGYKDSTERAAYCRKEAAYVAAEALFDAQQYQQAEAAFLALGAHSDSLQRAQESGYCYGMSLFDSGSYAAAYEKFTSLADYKDSSLKANQSGYLHAGNLTAEGKLHEAYLMYVQIADYEDSFDLGQTAEYQYAFNCIEKEQYIDAIEAFIRLKNYKDSAAELQNTRYIYAEHLMNTSQWEDAYEQYVELKDYKQSKQKALEARYEHACQLMDEQQYIPAVQIFTELKEHSDSASLLLDAKYLYASSNLEKTNAVTAQYLEELALISYLDANTLYNRLFGWKVTLTAVNTDESDGQTIMDTVPVNTPYLHFRFLLEGGKPSEVIDLTYKIIWPNGVQKSGKGEWKRAANGYYLDCNWSHGLYEDLKKAKAGTMMVQVYNKTTGEFLGEGSIAITN